MKSYTEVLTEDRRLVILRLLKESLGSANESVLHSGLEQLGHTRQPRAQIREDIRYLVRLDLIVTELVGDVIVCTITKAGVDVADGRIRVEGVKTPSIGI